jgi:hypothetical protein
MSKRKAEQEEHLADKKGKSVSIDTIDCTNRYKARELIHLIKKAKRPKSGKKIVLPWIVLALGPVTPKLFPFTNSDGLIEHKDFDSVTIEKIEISEEYQKQGVFTELVKYLLETCGCVHLNNVSSQMLLDKLKSSTHWICVDAHPCLHSSWYRCTINDPFTLF